MTTRNIPPHLIEKWRLEFEKEIPNSNTVKCPDGCYVLGLIDAMWKGFLLARSTVDIELPAFQLMEDPDGQGRGEYVMREVLEANIQKQGYRVAGEK